MKCQKSLKKLSDVGGECTFLLSKGYTVISGPVLDKFNHRAYIVLTPCGHEWEAPFTNILKQIKNAEAKGLRPACGTCGPKHRFAKALEKYVDKYGVDYDLAAFKDYSKKTRGLSEVTYKNNLALINPNAVTRGRHEHHVDHIIPIIECFKRGWTPEQAAHISNLQMLHWKENLTKGSVTG